MNLFKILGESQYNRKKILFKLILNLLLLFLVIILILDDTFYRQIYRFINFFSE